MTQVLSLDLGITTGWCVRNLHGDCVAAGHQEWPGEEGLAIFYRSLIDRYLPSYVVIEAPVLIARGELQGKLAMLIREAKGVFRNNTDWITPSQWKPRYGKHPIPQDVKLATTHAKDAYRMLEWWLKTRQRSSNVSNS